MIITNDLIYILALLFSVLLLAVIILIYLYLNSLSKYSKLKTAGLSEKDESVLTNAKKISDDLIKKAELESNKIIEVSKDLNHKFDQITEKFIEELAVKWSKEASEIFTKNTSKLEGLLVNKLNDIYKNESDSLINFKKTKINDFEKNLESYLKSISKDILKKEIDIDNHKKLIKSALDKAIKNGLFD